MALFQYDALGRRVAKSLGGVLTRPVYAGPWIVEEQFTFNGVDWAFKAAYVHGPGVDNLVMMRHQDFFDVDGDSDFAELKNLFYHHNRIGSVVALTCPNGQVVEQYRHNILIRPLTLYSGPAPREYVPIEER